MNATTYYTAVRVEAENNAEEWWGALRERYPDFARSLEKNNSAVIAAALWDKLAALPGFSNGPAYAPTALIYLGGGGAQWVDFLAARHQVFDSLS